MEQHCSRYSIDPTSHARLSDEEIIGLNTYDFMAHVGKRVINPGGLSGRDQILALINPEPGSRVLEIGCGNGQAACHIAKRYDCQVTAVDISPSMIELAETQARLEGVNHQVDCRVGDITALPFDDRQFDYVITQAVIMFVDHGEAIREILRVLGPGGLYAGLEFCWRKPPDDGIREQTYRICGCTTLEFHSEENWGLNLSGNGLDNVRTTEHPFGLLSLRGFLRDEGWRNSLQIAGKVLRRKANIRRMRQIWQHFSQHLDYFSYVVMTGQKGGSEGLGRNPEIETPLQ